MRRCRDSRRQPITSPLALTPFLATEGLCTYAQACSVWLSVTSHSGSHSYRRRMRRERACMCMFQSARCYVACVIYVNMMKNVWIMLHTCICMQLRLYTDVPVEKKKYTNPNWSEGANNNNNSNDDDDDGLDLYSTFQDIQTLHIGAISHSHYGHRLLVVVGAKQYGKESCPSMQRQARMEREGNRQPFGYWTTR